MFEREIKYINEYLKKQPKMNFEIRKMGCGEIRLYGYINEKEEDKIIVEFKQPYIVDGLFEFTYESKGDFISVVDGNEAFDLNIKYDMNMGYTLFKISNINIDKYMFIAARKLTIITK